MTLPLNGRCENAVFYFFKQLESREALELAVYPMPQHEFHRVTYSFTLSFMHGKAIETATVEDVTPNIREAETLFNLICQNNLRPCHLCDAIYDFLGLLLYDSTADYGVAGI